MHSNICEQYYINQVLLHGGNNTFKGPYYQRGYDVRRIQYGNGLGGIFKALMHSATPLVKEAAKTMGKELISSGVGLLSDIATGKNFKKSVKSRVKEAGRNALRSGVKKAKQTLGGRINPTPLKRKKPASLTLVAKKPCKCQHRE